jgi:hypothetical protein
VGAIATTLIVSVFLLAFCGHDAAAAELRADLRDGRTPRSKRGGTRRTNYSWAQLMRRVFGIELAGLQAFFLTPGPIPVGRAIIVPIPNSQPLVGLSFGVQGLGVPTSNPAAGNMTNVHRETVR